MPTYEFRCPNGHEFERFYRKISDAASELPCPDCGAVAGRQLSAGAGLLFKGSGFYLTDYGKNAHRKAAPGASKSTETKPDSGEGKGGDSKPGGAKDAAPGETMKGDAKSSAEATKSKAPKAGGSGDKG